MGTTNQATGTEAIHLIGGLRVFGTRGIVDEGKKPNTEQNHRQFMMNPKLAAQVAHFVASHGFATGSIKTWWDNNRKSGLNKSQAKALSESVLAMLDEYRIDKALNEGLKGRLNDFFAPLVEDWLSDDDDDDDEEFVEEDIAPPAEEPVFEEEDIEDLLGSSEASVESTDMVSFEEIIAVVEGTPADRSAMVQGAILAFTGSDNALNSGAQRFYRNGSQKDGGISITGKGFNLTSPLDFLQKVAKHCGANLAGLASWRKGTGGNRDWASSVLKDQKSSITIGIAWCVVAVKAGVVTFDHDLRKYVSDETIEALHDYFVDPTADMTHPNAPTNGWFLPYKRGNADWKTSGDSIKSIVDSLLL